MTDETRALLDRLAALEALVAEQAEALRALRTEQAAPPLIPRVGPEDSAPGATQRATRRGMLTGAAAALGALGLSAAAGVPGAEAAPARATGGNMLIGQNNAPTAAADVTRLLNAPALVQTTIFQADNNTAGTTAIPSDFRTSVAGTNAIAAAAGQDQVGVYGRAVNGHGVVAEGLWPLRIVPGGTGAPPGTDSAGNIPKEGSFYYQNGSDVFWGNFSSVGADWRRIAANAQVGVLIAVGPVRVVDTRGTDGGPIGFDQAGNPIVAGAFPAVDTTRRYRVAGKSFLNPSTTFPTDIRGLLCNVTIVQASAGGGFVTLFNAALTTPPNASTLNPSAGIIANSAFVAVPLSGPNAGNIAVRSVGDQPRDIVIDVVGYYF